MATIQIRNVPEDVYRIYRTRATAAGMSLQGYLLAELTHNASLRTPAELVAEVERRIHAEALSRTSAEDVLRINRESH